MRFSRVLALTAMRMHVQTLTFTSLWFHIIKIIKMEDYEGEKHLNMEKNEFT